jgi:hypothetical protein
MASPDLSNYVDLTLFDLDPQDVYEAFQADATLKLPDWVPVEGNTEVVIAEALAVEVAEAIYAINRVPGAVVEIFLQMYDVVRDLGTQPQAVLTWTVSDPQGHSIPAGARARLNLGTAYIPIVFSTDVDLVIPPGSTSGTVTATGDRFTADANEVALPVKLEILDGIVFADSVSITSWNAFGKDTEDDIAWMTRGVNELKQLSSVLSFPDHFTNFALQTSGVYRAKTIDNYNPDTPGSPPGSVGGHIAVYVYNKETPVDNGIRAQLELDMTTKAMSNLAVHVRDATVTPVDVTATIRYEASADPGVVLQSVRDALAATFDSSAWDWSDVIRRNSIIALLSQVDGVAFVESLTVPATDVTLPGIANLVTQGAWTLSLVNVNAP